MVILDLVYFDGSFRVRVLVFACLRSAAEFGFLGVDFASCVTGWWVVDFGWLLVCCAWICCYG